MLDTKAEEESLGMKEEMRMTETENKIAIQLHLNTSGMLSFDIHGEMSESAWPKQRQPATLYTCLAGPCSCSQQTEDELYTTLSTLSHSRREVFVHLQQ